MAFEESVEKGILLRILKEGSIKRAESLGLRDWHFSDLECQNAFIAISKHSRRKATLGQTPSIKYMAKLCPEFDLSYPCPEERLSELVGDLLSNCLRRELEETLVDVKTIMKNFDQPTMALDYLLKKSRELSQDSNIPTHIQVDMPLGLKSTLDNYNAIVEGGGMLGPSWPWDPLNLVTQGHRNGHLNIFYAPSKAGKTWTVLYCMIHAFLHFNSRVLIITTEMPCEEIYERIACILAKVDNRKLQRGLLSPEELDKLKATVEFFNNEHYNGLLDASQDISGTNHRSIRVVNGIGGGHQFVRDQIEEFEPDLLFIDGIYNVAEGDQNHAMVKKVVADVKKVALDYNIPISATAQTNRSGWIKLKDLDVDSYSDIGMSSGIIFYADAVIRVHRFCAGRDENGMRIYKQYLNAPALRRDHAEPWVINYNPGYDFDLYATGVSPQEAANWEEEEDDNPSTQDGPNFNSNPNNFLGRS